MDRKPKSVHGPKPRIGPDLLGTCGGPQHTVPSPRPMAEMLHCREPMRLASTARCRRAQPIARLGCTGAQPVPGLKGLGALPISRFSGLGAQPMVRLVAPQAQPMARLRGPGTEPMARLRGPGAYGRTQGRKNDAEHTGQYSRRAIAATLANRLEKKIASIRAQPLKAALPELVLSL